MITAIHTLVYSDDPTATRAFFKDVLQWPFSPEESGDPADWLIFATGPSELGVHPTGGEHEGRAYASPRHHQIALMCDDLDKTVRELRGRGATFTGNTSDMGWGIGIELQVPGADDMLLYQPRHAPAYHLGQ
ncbi:VOC family protein [Granulicoccus phenolivorans]|uniref:VOC family protein n=1 Tax=Granulicoccus phenolivorans TaxID=266854 RepID=UPI00040299E6|nr:VOC family protein [Granulicoccus phenolivorans]